MFLKKSRELPCEVSLICQLIDIIAWNLISINDDSNASNVVGRHSYASESSACDNTLHVNGVYMEGKTCQTFLGQP